jgi:hypothetical protein
MVQRYLDLHTKYLSDAEKLLSEGDYPQASEKYWGAVAQMIKVVAEERGWRHFSHAELRSAVRLLFNETGDVDLPQLMRFAESLHANFYENFLTADEVRVRFQDVHNFIEKLRAMRPNHA